MGGADSAYVRKTIAGFACYQGFLYAFLYRGTNQLASFSPFQLERIELMAVLACFIGGFALVALSSAKVRRALLSPRLLMPCGTLAALSACAAGALPPGAPSIALKALGAGIPSALLLCAWARSLEAWPVDRAIPLVFIASALGAAVCFVADSLKVDAAGLLLCCLALGSALLLRSVRAAERPAFLADERGDEREGGPAREASLAASAASSRAGADASGASSPEGGSRLSGRVLAGTVVFGVATGLMETYGSDPGMVANPSLGLTLLTFVLFCIAALQTFNAAGQGAFPVRRRVQAAPPRADAGPLDAAYRLAVLLMMAGFMLIPLIATFGLPSEAVVLAGYLALAVVLVSLFLALGRLGNGDCVLSFCRGFSALFAGEVAGIVLGNAADMLSAAGGRSIAAAAAGIAVLYAYLFLFTDRDLHDLSVAVRRTDRFDEACRRIAAMAKLSKRESEILPLALRGRTAERIAGEFFISKNTVDTHLRRIYAKCGVHTRQELIDLAERTEKASTTWK